VVPPGPAQIAADVRAPHVAFLHGDAALLSIATAAVGLGITFDGGVARVAGSAAELQLLAAELEERGSALAAHLRRYLEPVREWRLRTRALSLDRPTLMGILNLTEDSFSGDGVGREIAGALRHADALRSAGATIVDVGAETARADRPVLDADGEAALVGPVVVALAREGHCVSSDTYKPLVARAALESGAEIVNDISGLTIGIGAAEEAARARAGYVLNYSYSVPKRRPDAPPVYADVVAETVAWMFQRLDRLRVAGLADEAVAIDPGIAFGKSHDEDVQVLRRLGELATLGRPVLLAHSRKNYVGSVNGHPPTDRDLETHVSSALAFAAGARIFRVHDVEGARRALEIASAIVAALAGAFAPDGESWPWRAGASATHMTRAEPDKAAPGGQRW
jgi:dihydropteroate synthase